MRKCELCGAETPKKLGTCSRCGFEFQKEIRSDVRDRAILGKHGGKTEDRVRRDLNNKRARLAAYLDNLSAKSLSSEELASLLSDALAFLEIPLAMGVEDELRFDGHETDFISLLVKNLERTDRDNGSPIGTAATYIRLSNALHSMGKTEYAMKMIDTALLINPKDRDAIYGKAKLLFYSKKYEPAKKCLERLISGGDSENAKYLYELIEQLEV